MRNIPNRCVDKKRVLSLFLGDCLEELDNVSSNTVDLVLADPPYGKIDCRWDSVIPLELMWEQLKRVLKAQGVIVLMASQPFTTALISSNMKMFKYCWVWVKTKPSGYQLAKVKPMSKHEDIVVFGRGRLCYNPQMILRDRPRIGIVQSTNRQMKISGGGVFRAHRTYTHRYPTTVLVAPNSNQKNKIHPTQKPLELMGYLIRTYSNRGETVLDFTMGSGTTGVAARKLERSFIGIESNERYFQIAKRRIGRVHL